MTRKARPPGVQPTVWKSVDQIDRGIRKIQRLIEKVKALDPTKLRYDDQQIENVEVEIRNALMEVFGHTSPIFRQHSTHRIQHGNPSLGNSKNRNQQKFAAGIGQTVTMLEGLVEHLNDQREEFEPPKPEPAESTPAIPSQIYIQNVGQLAVGDIQQNINIVAVMEALVEEIEKSPDIPADQKRTLTDTFKRLLGNQHVQKIGTQVILELFKKAVTG